MVLIQQKVKEAYGVWLEPEIMVIGDDEPELTGNLAEVTDLIRRRGRPGSSGPDRARCVLVWDCPGDVVQYSVIERKKGYLRGVS